MEEESPRRRLTHQERKERRRKIAEFVRENQDLSAAAEAFGVRPSMVRLSCKEFDVSIPRKNNTIASLGSFQILKALLDGKKPSEIASEHSITRQRVGLVVKSAREAGFAV